MAKDRFQEGLNQLNQIQDPTTREAAIAMYDPDGSGIPGPVDHAGALIDYAKKNNLDPALLTAKISLDLQATPHILRAINMAHEKTKGKKLTLFTLAGAFIRIGHEVALLLGKKP